MFHPSEVELSETTRTILEDVERIKPTRVVFDSLSELRLLAGNPLRYRRQILALKQFFAGRQCTVLFLDDMTSANHDLQVQSIAHGVVRLEQIVPGVRRRAAAAHRHQVPRRPLPRRLPRLRHPARRARGLSAAGRRGAHRSRPSARSCGSGIARDGRAARRRHRAGHQHADRRRGGNRQVVPRRAVRRGGRGAGRARGAVHLRREHQHPAHPERRAWGSTSSSTSTRGGSRCSRWTRPSCPRASCCTPSARPSRSGGASIIVIDSLNGYLNAMPDERFLIIQLHELLTYLGQAGVATILIGAHHGLIGSQMVAPGRCQLPGRRGHPDALLRGQGRGPAGDLGGEEARRRARADHPRVPAAAADGSASASRCATSAAC